MRFITSVLLALAAISSTVVAENPNAFIKPDGSAPLQAGETTTITWTPGSPGPVTIKLRKGPSTSLSPGDIIAAGIPNSGSYSWTIPSDTPAGSDYALSITDDTGAVDVNYTGLFTINSDVAPKPTSSGTTTRDTTTTTSGSASYTTGTHTKPHNSTMTTITSRPYNSTTTGSSNATTTISRSSETSEAAETESDSDSEPTSASTSTRPSTPSSSTNPTSGAISLLNSPLALVVCVLGAVFYLN